MRELWAQRFSSRPCDLPPASNGACARALAPLRAHVGVLARFPSQPANVPTAVRCRSLCMVLALGVVDAGATSHTCCSSASEMRSALAVRAGLGSLHSGVFESAPTASRQHAIGARHAIYALRCGGWPQSWGRGARAAQPAPTHFSDERGCGAFSTRANSRGPWRRT
jgi:hypothetical protein